MHCRLAQARLLRYLDGELTARESEDLAAHLASCGPCSRELQTLRREAQHLRGALRKSPSPRLKLCLLRRLGALARTPRPSGVWGRLAGPRFWRSLAVCAASLVLALVGIALVSPPAYATLTSSALRFGAQANAAASQRFPAWDDFVRVIAALRMMAGI